MTESAQNTDLIPGLPDDAGITARLKEFVQDKDAFSSNTWSQLMSVMAVCWRWSKENQRSFLPMLSSDFRDYLSWLQETGRASSTVSTHASLIFMLHRNAGVTPPNTSPLIYRVMSTPRLAGRFRTYISRADSDEEDKPDGCALRGAGRPGATLQAY
jgi:hypothetical protein